MGYYLLLHQLLLFTLWSPPIPTKLKNSLLPITAIQTFVTTYCYGSDEFITIILLHAQNLQYQVISKKNKTHNIQKRIKISKNQKADNIQKDVF
jgi:hypothetical protein